MEPENAKGHPKNYSGANLGGKPVKNKNVASSSSSSSSSLSSMSTLEFDIGDSGHHHNSTFNPLVLKNPSTESSPMKSSQVQTMGQLPDYDPKRIPSSVFSTKNPNTFEWSTTSKESLFSLRIGSDNYSLDYGEFSELPKSENWNNSPPKPFTVPGELPRINKRNNNIPSHPHHQAQPNGASSLPQQVPSSRVLTSQHLEVENNNDSKNLASSVGSEAKVTQASDQSVSIAIRVPDTAVKNAAATEDTSPSNAPLSFPSPPLCSDGSRTSSKKSFAFPVLVNEGEKNTTSLNVVPEKTELPQPQSVKETSKAPTKWRWCSCFSCFRQGG